MAITFPTTLDSFTNPTASTIRHATGGQSVAATVTDIQDAVEALEAKVGVDSSAVATSHDYKLANFTVADITDLSATAAELDILSGATLDVNELNILDGVTSSADDLNNGVNPIGAVISWAGSSGALPTGWVLCDGSAISRTSYSALFSALGTTFGVGDGATTFNVPDLTDKFVMGAGSTYDRGDTGGSVSIDTSHTHTVASHNHSIPSHTHDGGTLVTELRIGTSSIDYQEVSASSYDMNIGSAIAGRGASSLTGQTGGADVQGATGAWSGTSGNATPATDSQGGSTSILPPYVGLFQIIRAQ